MDDLINNNEKLQSLKNMENVHHLIGTAYKTLGNPLVMYDMAYKLLAYTENMVTDDQFWNEIITTGSYSSKSIEFFKNEYFIDAAANASTVAFLTSNKLKYDRILGKIRNKDNITVAYLTIVSCNKPFEENDSAIFESLCEKISKEIGEIEFYRNYGERCQEIVIKDLIEGNIHDKRLYAPHIADIYEGLKNNIYLAVADISECDNIGYVKLVQFRDLFKQAHSSFKYFIYSKYILIFVSTNSENLDVKRCLNKLKLIFEENNIHVGISSRFENLYELRNSYLKAIDALNFGLKNNNKGYRIFHTAK